MMCRQAFHLYLLLTQQSGDKLASHQKGPYHLELYHCRQTALVSDRWPLGETLAPHGLDCEANQRQANQRGCVPVNLPVI